MSLENTVSVIIPAYNAEKTIEKTLRSILEQTHAELEIIVVNDGSSDNTESVVSALCQEDVRLRLINTPNGGVSRARNKGIEMASADYIMFCDADDLYLPDTVEVLLNSLIPHEADLCSARFSALRPGSQPRIIDSADLEVWQGTQALCHFLEDDPICYSVCTKIFRRELLKDIRFCEGRKINEDGYFVFQCFTKNPKVVALARTVYLYTVNPSSATHEAFGEKFLDILYFNELQEKFLTEHHPELAAKTANMVIKSRMALLKKMCMTFLPKYRPTAKQCIRDIKKRKKFFLPLHKADKRFFFVITHHLYLPYKLFYRFAKKVKKG